MMCNMQREEAREVIESALRLTRERVAGGLDEKEIQRERLADLIARMRPDGCEEPTAADLADALGDPDGKGLREAIRAWAEDAPGIPQ